jgi:hypothetical protein
MRKKLRNGIVVGSRGLSGWWELERLFVAVFKEGGAFVRLFVGRRSKMNDGCGGDGFSRREYGVDL